MDSINDFKEILSLGELMFENMRKYKKRVVQYIVETDEEDTFEQLLQRSIRTAITLKNKNGIKPGDIIGLCTKNHKNSCVPIIAGQFLGAINANFDFNLTHNSMVKLLELVQPKIMFVDLDEMPHVENCLQKAKANVELVVFGSTNKYTEFNEYIKPNVEENYFSPTKIKNNKDTAMILFSSGTTSTPKGICLSHYCLIRQYNNGAWFYNASNIRDVYLISSNLYWISAVGTLIRSILYGNAKIVYPKFDAREMWRYIEKYRVTFMLLVPHLAAEFVCNIPEKVDISSLKNFLTGASLVTKKLMEDLKRSLPGVVVIQGYGQTEVGGLISIFNSNDEREVELQNKKPQSCGIIWNEYQWKIVDPETEEVLGPHKPGEMRVKSDFLMNGYYKMDSSSVFDSEGYLRTGDIMYYDEDHCFYVVDRIKEMFKCRGTHIIPSILEEILLTHPSVKEAVVIGVPHEVDEHRPMAVVVLKNENDGVTAEEIEKFVEQQVYDVQRLRGGVKLVKALPRTSTGKIMRRFVKDVVLKL